MGKANIIAKVGAVTVSMASFILGVTLPETPWIDENRAVYVSAVAFGALIIGILLWIFGNRLTKKETNETSTLDYTEHPLWKMYLNINGLIRQLREIAPSVYEDIRDMPTTRVSVFYEEIRIKNITTNIEIEMQNCIDSNLCNLYRQLLNYELHCALFAINPTASGDFNLENKHQEIRNRTIKLIRGDK